MKRSGSISGYAPGKKGVIDWLVKEVCQDLEAWGRRGQRVILKSDGEESIVALKKAIGDMYAGGWTAEEGSLEAGEMEHEEEGGLGESLS